MYKIPKQTRDNLINLIANAVHPNVSYAQVAQALNELQEAEEIKEDKKK